MAVWNRELDAARSMIDDLLAVVANDRRSIVSSIESGVEHRTPENIQLFTEKRLN